MRRMGGRIARTPAWVLLAIVALVGVSAPAWSAPADPDGDGLPTAFERDRSRTDPLVADSDGDGVPDDLEDPDDDGLVTRWEQRLGLHPRRADTDRDGTSDGNADRDGDRLRNRFEVARSLTDPRTTDTDHDGIRDGAEDPDGDQLSNAGEQRFGTRPDDADSDGDDVDDWHEDANDDDRADGRTQDRRRVPAALQPPLSSPFDRPASHAACHQGQRSSVVIACRATTRGRVRVVLVGDSHALQWRGPLQRVARSRGWRVWVITKSACQIADTPTTNRSCRAWREAAIRRVRSLDADIVIVGGHLRFINDDGSVRRKGARQWREGMSRTLRRLDRVAGTVVLLGDTPRFGDPVGCLKRHRGDISACSRRRHVAVSEARVAVERRAAEAAGVRYRRTDHMTCPYDPCPVVLDRTLVAYDQGHLTVRFATSLWRGLRRLLPER
jgi:hypothetical protein